MHNYCCVNKASKCPAINSSKCSKLRGFFENTFFFNRPHILKPHRVKSRDLAGHSIVPLLSIYSESGVNKGSNIKTVVQRCPVLLPNNLMTFASLKKLSCLATLITPPVVFPINFQKKNQEKKY